MELQCLAIICQQTSQEFRSQEFSTRDSGCTFRFRLHTLKKSHQDAKSSHLRITRKTGLNNINLPDHDLSAHQGI